MSGVPGKTTLLTQLDRTEIHNRVFTLYRRAQEYAALLDAAGNIERAEEVREACRNVARNHDLDVILKGTR